MEDSLKKRRERLASPTPTARNMKKRKKEEGLSQDPRPLKRLCR